MILGVKVSNKWRFVVKKEHPRFFQNSSTIEISLSLSLWWVSIIWNTMLFVQVWYHNVVEGNLSGTPVCWLGFLWVIWIDYFSCLHFSTDARSTLFWDCRDALAQKKSPSLVTTCILAWHFFCSDPSFWYWYFNHDFIMISGRIAGWTFNKLFHWTILIILSYWGVFFAGKFCLGTMCVLMSPWLRTADTLSGYCFFFILFIGVRWYVL